MKSNFLSSSNVSCLYKSYRHFVNNALCLLILLALTISCEDKVIENTGTRIQLNTDATLGSVLTDKDGRTLYFFANDASGENTCAGDCEKFWPPFNVESLSSADIPDGILQSDFSTVTTASGKTQLAYKGRPLYNYAPLVNGANKLEEPGQTLGEGISDVWFAMKPDYSIMLTKGQLLGIDGKKYLSNSTEGEGTTLYFTDAHGVTLYTFKNDEPNKNNFTASDFSNNGVWSIYETDKIVVPSSLDKTLFGSIDVFGKKQLTYRGWPLYFFGQDAGVMGSNKGISFPTPGIWKVATEDAGDPTPKAIKLQTNATLGKILTDKDGRTLYYFANDPTPVNNCAGGCVALWPVYNVENLTANQVGSGLSFSDFSSITLAGGGKQITYKGRPLHYYAPAVSGTNTPEAAGQTGGENFAGFWFVAKPDYSVMLTNAQLIGKDGKNYLSNYTEGVGKTNYFTDAKGVTLYTFSLDKQNKNNFTASDFSNNGVWSIYETDKITVTSALDKTLFGSIDVFGKKQLTYKGWPLYFFGEDAGVMGSNKGVSFPVPGKWPVAVKDIAAAPL